MSPRKKIQPRITTPKEKPTPAEVIVLRMNMASLNRDKVEEMESHIQLMLIMRMLYENPDYANLLPNKNADRGMSLLITAIDHIVEHDPYFKLELMGKENLARYGVLFMRLIRAHEGDSISIVEKIEELFGHEVAYITEHMAQASRHYLLALRSQAVLNHKTPEPIGPMLKRVFRGDHDHPHFLEDTDKKVPPNFCEQWHQRHSNLLGR